MTEPREEPTPAAPPSRRDSAELRSASLTGLFILAVLYTLHLAREVILPVVLSIFLALMLQPLVRRLRRWKVPHGLAPLLVVGALFVAIVAAGWWAWDPVAERIAEAPRDLRRLETRLRELLKPVERMAQTAERVDELAEVGKPEGTPQVEIRGPKLSDILVGGAWQALAGGFLVLVMTYFFLATGDRLLRKLPRVVARPEAERMVRMVEDAEQTLSRYLITITLINLGLGIVTGLAMLALGMPTPMLLGLAVGLANFVPYLGTAVMTAVITMLSLLTFESPARILAPPIAYLVINTIETELVTPHLLGRSLPLNPLVIFLAFLFWWWLWGIPGAVIAVPILATIKIVSDRTESLKGLGEFLGR
jgi:predicted PurR-regulated permease PerM